MRLSAQALTPSVDYRITPVPTQGGTACLLVSVSLIGNPSESTNFVLPTLPPAFGKPQSEIGDFAVVGGRIISRSPELVVAHEPGARLTIKYRVSSPTDAEVQVSPAIMSISVRQGWFAGFGWGFLIVPKGREQDPATFGWEKIPAEVECFDTFGTRPLTVSDAQGRFLVGGSNVEEWHETLNGADLRFVGVGRLPGSAEDFRAMVRRTLTAERQMLQDKGGDYMVAFISLPPNATHTDPFSASGSDHGLLAFGRNDKPLSYYQGHIAHEAFHYWLPFGIGGMPDDAASYRNWLSEGLNDALTGRLLLRTGEQTLEEYAGSLNEDLLAYPKSSARNMTAAKLDQSQTSDAFKIPYLRGEIASLVFDDMLTKATGRKVHLEDVVRQAIVTARANKSVHRAVSADVLFPQTMASLGGPNVADLLDRFMVQGETIVLPKDIFAGCAIVSSVPIGPGGGVTKATAQHVEILSTLTTSQRAACTRRIAGID